MKCINIISALFFISSSEAEPTSAIIIERKLSCSQNKFSLHTTKPGGSTGPILFQRWGPGQRTCARPEDPCPTATEAGQYLLLLLQLSGRSHPISGKQVASGWPALNYRLLVKLRFFVVAAAAAFENFHNCMIFISKLWTETIRGASNCVLIVVATGK